jgi:hypothetical protein
MLEVLNRDHVSLEGDISMPRIAYYYQDCPTCGRSLQVRVEYLGRLLCCPHCRGEFRAADSANAPVAADGRGVNLIDRANELLESVHLQQHTDWS